MPPCRRSHRHAWLIAATLAGCGSAPVERAPTPTASPASPGIVDPALPEDSAAPGVADSPPSAATTSVAQLGTGHHVQALHITILSTTEAREGIGEWGFAALVEADGQRLLFDTGAQRQTVVRNAQTLGIDLRTVPTVVLSHHHDDHVGGLLALRESVVEGTPSALATVHAARGIFEPRHFRTKTHEVNDMRTIRPAFEQTGGRFVVHDGPEEILAGVWVTGPVPRVHPERNFGTGRRVPQGDGWVEDTLPESQSLVVDTAEGLVVLSGCGHAGIVNTVTHARSTIRSAPVHAAVGGFHLHRATPSHLDWTATRLSQVGLENFFGAHCTGRPAVRRMAEATTGDARELVVGDRITLGAAP